MFSRSKGRHVRVFRLLVLKVVSWQKALEKKGGDQEVVAEEHVALLRDLARGYRISLLFVDNIADWCREQGISKRTGKGR